jgi:ABC-2 type transport system ATP-binding protein
LEAGKLAETAIEAADLRFRYGRAYAVDGVSLEVERGEVLCVIGANGAGKTTLLSLLGGMVLPQQGHVRVFGLDRWRDNFAIRKRSTFLLAEPAFGESLTPYEFLRFFAQIYGVPKQTLLDRVKRLAVDMDMIEHWNKPWTKLSLGMLKKTGLIAAFLPDAELRILDEPFAGGIDPMAMETLYAWIAAAKSRNETIIFSTQVLEQAESAADRILMLEDGHIRALGSPDEVIALADVDANEPRALYKAFLELTSKRREQ